MIIVISNSSIEMTFSRLIDLSNGIRFRNYFVSHQSRHSGKELCLPKPVTVVISQQIGCFIDLNRIILCLKDLVNDVLTLIW